MEALILCFRGEPLREFRLGRGALEVGRGAGCDIVVHDPEIAEHHFLIEGRAGAVFVHDVSSGGTPRAEPRVLEPGGTLPVGKNYTLVRMVDVPTRPVSTGATTERIVLPGPSSAFALLIGRGSNARQVSLEQRPIEIGTAACNDVVLWDRSVSARHLRLEPGEAGVVVRDLGSRNGTYIDGVPVRVGRVLGSALLRVGRTHMALVPRGRGGDTRIDGMVAASPPMLRVVGEIERFARLPWPVLIEGESGVGKEGVARALHHRGLRATRPFVALNAGGLPRDLIESELFGHEKGAFTGATGARRGVFEQAHTGTLFLDEIGELPLDMQARLLRVLETWEVRRVGAEASTRVDVRLVCATHRDLQAMVQSGAFREDLYYRLARLVIWVPPLRERVEDLKALVPHFFEEMGAELGHRELTREALARLCAYDWPGNARELRNVLCAAAASTGSALLDENDVAMALGRVARPIATLTSSGSLRDAVLSHGGNLSATARALGIPRTTLRDKLREYGGRGTDEEQGIEAESDGVVSAS